MNRIDEDRYAEMMRLMVPHIESDAAECQRPVVSASRRCRKRPPRAEDLAVIREMWGSGATTAAIGCALGLSLTTVLKWRKLIGLSGRQLLWSAEDDAFLLSRYRCMSPRIIGMNLPSGRRAGRNAVIGRYHRLKARKNREQAGGQHTGAPTQG